MRAIDGYSFNSATAADSPAFKLGGGVYILDVVANWNSGSITLKRQGPDGGAFLTVATALTADGTTGDIVLSAGTYKLVVASASGIYATVARVPGE